jgi:tagatose-6-phosphate ketose/aldose isomerase
MGRLLDREEGERLRLGYGHTLREIAHQPLTWLETAERALARAPELESALGHITGAGAGGTLVLTGSGSSLFAGECLAPGLQAALGVPVLAITAGELLTHVERRLPPRGEVLLVSFGRSGNSPESCAVIDALLDRVPRCEHLVVTCNAEGRMATRYAGHPRVRALVLDDRTNDRSLVMTSSFSNMVLAARLLARPRGAEQFRSRALGLARAAAAVLLGSVDALAAVARGRFRSAVYLGSGGNHGAAREAGLKMLEMTGGQVLTLAETHLGLRHGPMSAVDDEALAVSFLSTDTLVRAYELDLVRELRRKGLGARLVLVGRDVPEELVAPGDVRVDLASGVDDDEAVLLHVLTGQLLAFFRCLHLGLRPDSPSEEGVITRVVEEFEIHRRA